MSYKISNILQFPQSTLQYIPHEECDLSLTRGLPLLGGVLSDTHYVWHAKGPCLEVRNTKTGTKVGAWTFGCILKDSNTRVVCVDEIQRLNGRLSLLAVGIECTISGGLVCVFDVFGSKVIRAIQIKEKLTSLHVVDSGCEVLNLPGPLRNFDGIVAVGTEGGNVFLIDICRQICEEGLYVATVRDELCPCQLVLLTSRDIPNIEYYKQQSVRDGDHLAIHLNIVLNSLTKHFTLKGPKGDDRIHVNREEVKISALYYCSQLTSLLIGYNFGAFQLWDLTSASLVYTSPVCDEHLPITHFALQEPADDPRAFCYIWASYSNSEPFQSELPFAVMYSICYESKEYHEGYGYLYQDFQSCSVRFQIELGQLDEHRSVSKAKGGYCLGLEPICKTAVNKELHAHDNTGDTLALCAISWTVWFNQNDTQSYMIVFDLNQWYKEQMPHFTKGNDSFNYILKVGISDIISMTGHKSGHLLDAKIDQKSLRQFSGVQRLEEHFCPTALSFDLWVLRENNVVLLHSEGLQKALLNQIEAAGPLCLIRPNDVYRQVITLGLSPLFTDICMNMPVTTDTQREIILNVGLEHQLVRWLCKCAEEWANGSFSSAGCSLDFLVHWAFQRAILLKNNCDKYCMPLFDYSQSRLDNNTSILLNSCTRQINNICTLYSFVINKLSVFISNPELVKEQHISLKMVSMYFEVLQWLVNVGLLPECHPSTYPRPDNAERISAPYPVQELTEYYNEKRAQLQLLSKETFVSSDSLLFIDNLINNKCGAEQLQKQWQEDGGSGLYPPPSLQSMLRTYLVEGADISHKHSLVIYVFLDLAMALDQRRYASVITHLIKFPAVFKVTSSIIKITQAFWQLDHGDYTTAMEQLLDPFVLSDDLQPWHHAIAMRALLLQNQYNFALLYMQVRRPPITDEKDVLTVISLFIANNMLDEAFYFKNQHQNNNEETLLMHLFNECNKNESLHVLLYRCLNTNEEKAFFKYLKSVENPSLLDLQVFYYLMRSRFVEAFDAHHNSKRKHPESQGLIGQRNATKTDQIVRIFKTLLPDVNRNLVEVIRKERTNIWKEVARPTPLSVFVHNTKEQVKYKSTIIQAALAKAKHTFNDSINNSKFRDIVTEETPFLRTPKASKTPSRHSTPVITPKVIEINEDGMESIPSPCKKLKLTPRTSTTSPTCSRNISIHSKMLTPIVKRKSPTQKDQSLSNTSNINVCTPQSILKVKNIESCNESVPDDSNVTDILEDIEGFPRLETRSRKFGLGLLPRMSLSRTPLRAHVKFDDAARISSSFSEESNQSNKPSLNSTTLEDPSINKSTLSSKDLSFMISSKNSSASNGSNTDEIFYSPNTSINESSKSEAENNSTKTQTGPQNEEVGMEVDENRKSQDGLSPLPQSPRRRRSYKRSLCETPPVRSSPRRTKNPTVQNTKSVLDIPKDPNVDLENTEKSTVTTSQEESVLSDVEPYQSHSSSFNQSSRLLQKVRARKSLNRQVLEHTTFSRIMSTPLLADREISRETSVSKTQKNVISDCTQNTSEVITIETKMDISDITTSEFNSPVSSHKHSESSSVFMTKSFETNLDSDTSINSSIPLNSPQLPERLKMSDSLMEYMKSRTNKYNSDDRTAAKAEEVTETQVHSTNSEETLKPLVKYYPESVIVYEDLSSGAEDIEEVLTASRQQMDNSKMYGESSNYLGTEHEENISSVIDNKRHSPEEQKGSIGETIHVRANLRITKRSSMQSEKLATEEGTTSNTTENEQLMTSLKEKSIDAELPQTVSPSTNQSEKHLEKVKGRKSLSRMVLEHNTFSRIMSTPIVSDNATIKETSAHEMERIPNSLLEPKILDSSNGHASTSSIFEGHLDSDTSTECNISLDCPELPDRLKISDSLLEYMKSRSNKYSDVHEDSKTQNEEFEPVETQAKNSQISTIEQDKFTPKPTEVYEDLSSGAEDIEEVLMANKQQTDNANLYAEFSNCSENSYDVLEKNIFEIESRRHSSVRDIVQENLQNISNVTSLTSGSFHIPDAEKAFASSSSKAEISILSADSYIADAEKGFIADDDTFHLSDAEKAFTASDQTVNLSKQQSEVIEINSSSNEESSNNEHSDTSDCRSSDKSDNTVDDDLNISYERNIHVEENSRSLLDSEFSATTPDHLSEHDRHDDNLAEEKENIIEHAKESTNDSELEINENTSVESINNDQSNKENDEPVSVPVTVEYAEVDDNIVDLEAEHSLQTAENIDNLIAPIVEEGTEISVHNENKDTCSVYKEAVSLQMDKDKMEEPEKDDSDSDKNTIMTMNYQDDCIKVSLHLEEAIQKNQENDKDKKSEIIQKDNLTEDKINIDEISEENYSKDVQSYQLEGNLSVDMEINVKTDDHIVQNEELHETTREQQTNTPNVVLKDKTTSIQDVAKEKKDQSTNTTMSTTADEIRSGRKQLMIKIEQATNTTVFMPEQPSDPSKKDESVLDVDKTKERKVYHPKYGTMKIMSDDQTISSVSSDTTESESPPKPIVVTAQVHTSSKEHTETPLIKRVTRRNNALLSQTAESNILGSVSDPVLSMNVSHNIIDDDHSIFQQTPNIKAYVSDILGNSNLEDVSSSAEILTPGRRTRRSLSATTPTRSIQTRSSQIEKNEDQEKPSSAKKRPTQSLRRTRSASVDEGKQISRKRSLRSNSVDEKIEENVEEPKIKIKGRAPSVSYLPAIIEESKEQKTGRRSKSNSTVQTYATTRRLTRHQANLVKDIQTPSSVTPQDDSDEDKSLEVDIIDPIILLDKKPFQGKPDPEEEKVYLPSSSSNSTVSSFNKPMRRLSRSASAASDYSLPPSTTQPSTPKRRARPATGHTDSPSSSGVKMRLRKHSETSSVTSEKSDPPTPKKIRKKDVPNVDETISDVSVAVSTRSTRSRVNSSSSVKSETLDSPKRSTRSRHIVSAKTDLPEIIEEKIHENVKEHSNEKPVSKRQTRKKSSQ